MRTCFVSLAILSLTACTIFAGQDCSSKKRRSGKDKSTNSIVAVTRLIKHTRRSKPAYYEVRLELKNISKKPVLICNYPGNKPVRVYWQGPRGKVLKSNHYDWVTFLALAKISKSNFVTILPGKSCQIGPGGNENGVIFRCTKSNPLFGNSCEPGKHRVKLSYVNSETGRQFGLNHVWTGVVTGNEVTFTIEKEQREQTQEQS